MFKKGGYKKKIMDYLFVLIGCLLLAFAITSILKPNGLLTGGLTGISIVLEKLIHIKYTYIYYALSIAVLLSTWLLLGKVELFKILLISLFLPSLLIFFEGMNITFIENDMILASVYYGIIGGIGCGLILKSGFSQGGTDTIAKIIHLKVFPFISISQILLGIDTVLIAISAIAFDRNRALYAILTQVIIVKTIDIVLFGLGTKVVQLEIISEENEKISDYIMNSIKRGITIYKIKGGYTNSNKKKIVSLCSPREAILIKNFVAHVDPNAFMHVLPVNSAWGNGEGFNNLIEEE